MSNYLPFLCPTDKLDNTTRQKLLNNILAVSVQSDSAFNSVRRIVYKLDDSLCGIVYIGFMHNSLALLLQISELYLKSIQKFGRIDFKSEDFYLDTDKGKAKIPLFTEIFLKKPCLHQPYIIHYADEVFIGQQYLAEEIKNNEDLNKRLISFIILGRKLYQESDKAQLDKPNSSYAKEISYGIKLLIHVFGG